MLRDEIEPVELNIYNRTATYWWAVTVANRCLQHQKLCNIFADANFDPFLLALATLVSTGIKYYLRTATSSVKLKYFLRRGTPHFEQGMPMPYLDGLNSNYQIFNHFFPKSTSSNKNVMKWVESVSTVTHFIYCERTKL